MRTEDSSGEDRAAEAKAAPAAKKAEQATVLRGLARAESMVQIALALPLSTIVGWVIGDALGRHFHADWPAIAGLILGAVAGFVQIVRVASKANRSVR
jgi:ATP synthase protein I